MVKIHEIESTPLVEHDEFWSRLCLENKIIAALEDANVDVIGICGSVGMGKTTMARRVGEKAKQERLFRAVVMVTVGPRSNMNRTLHEILDYLGIRRKTNYESLLIILDDVREVLNLEKIWNLVREHWSSCKIMVTSRYLPVCRQMAGQQIFIVERLSVEESLKLLKKGIMEIPCLLRIAEVLVKTCGVPGKLREHGVRLQLVAQKIGGSVPHKSIKEAAWPEETVIPTGSFRVSSSTSILRLPKGFFLPRDESSNKETESDDISSQYEDNDMKRSLLSASEQSSMAKEVQRQENVTSPVIDWELLVETVQQHEESYIKDCILFCSVLPSRYQFTKDVLVWQWLAKAEDETIEKDCSQLFESLLSLDCIVTSGYDHFVGQTLYEVGDKMAVLLQNQHLEPTYLRYLNSKQSGLAKIEHLSLDFTGLESLNFGVLKQCCHLQTLIIHGCSGPKIQHLPPDLFLEMKDLKILNLSRTDIEELPSSIENAEGLRYLDMSETPVRWLPECICRFSNLQTLKLDGCLSLDGLPMSTSELTNLRHLVLDVVRQLQSMPEGIGQLSKLQTLGAFLVSEDGCSRIRELKDMNRLKGSLRVMNLENVTTKKEAAEAALCNKRDLKAIELQWSDIREEKNREEEEILESLQPPWGIRDLKILFYSGGRLPSWLADPSYDALVSLTLYRCRYFDSLIPLGELQSLKTLSIVENNEIVRIDRHFCSQRSQPTGDRRVAFPKLEKLSFDSFSRLETWMGLEEEDLPNLQSLSIDNCPRLVHLPLLSHMKSLVHMEISCCRELSCFPTDGLPIRLESLMIKDCPGLKERCCNEKSGAWANMARVPPALYIDNQRFL